jgi:hypothetical protein
LLVRRSNFQLSPVLFANVATSAAPVKSKLPIAAPEPGCEVTVIWLGTKTAQVAEGSPEQLTLNLVRLEYPVE